MHENSTRVHDNPHQTLQRALWTVFAEKNGVFIGNFVSFVIIFIGKKLGAHLLGSVRLLGKYGRIYYTALLSNDSQSQSFSDWAYLLLLPSIHIPCTILSVNDPGLLFFQFENLNLPV